MSIIKRVKASFGVVPRKAMESNDMSLKAKGLLAYLLCMPDDWQIYVSQLATVHKESKNTIAKTINELIDNGYITRQQKRGEGNRFAGYDYTVYDSPVSQNTVSQKAVSQKTGYGNLSTTNIDNTNIDNTKKDKGESLIFSSPEFKEAWQDWEQHRKEKKKKLTPTSIKKQFKQLEEIGEERAIKAINHSIAQGYTGIFEPKGSQNNQAKQTYSPTKVYG